MDIHGYMYLEGNLILCQLSKRMVVGSLSRAIEFPSHEFLAKFILSAMSFLLWSGP